jgi:hypothetical protein
MFVLYVIGIILLLGFCVMLISIRNAPHGFEDETGFYQAPSVDPATKPVTAPGRKSVVVKPLSAVNLR